MRSSRRKTRPSRVQALAASSVFALTAASASGLPWEIWESPVRLATLDPNDIVLERSSHCLQGCRYDRSNAGPEDPADNLYPERWLYRDGDEAIVFDERGPGAITRIWMTTGFGVSSCIDPAIHVRFYIDDASTPELDAPLAALFDGSTPPFTPPLVADRTQSSGGFLSYVPIAYAQSLRIALVGADNGGTNPCTGGSERLLWFQFQHHRLASGTPVASFTSGADFPAWRAFLAHAGDDPWNGLLTPENTSATLMPGETIELASHAGSGWLRGIRFNVPRSAYADIDLRLTFDGTIAAEMPLADFFATSSGAAIPARSVLAGEDASGWLYAWLPLPFAQSARVELVAAASLVAPVAIESALSFDTSAVPPDAGSYLATLTDSCVADGDLALYSHRGAGKIIGIAARYRTNGSPTLGYLEGDERAYLDDAIAPAWYGTGVEDFFGGGFYFDGGVFSLPLTGASEIDADGSASTAAYRWLVSDPIAYSGALRLTQEAGYAPLQPVPTCARSVVHAYRTEWASVIAYDRFEVGDASAAAHAYQPPTSVACASLNATFEDEPPTSRSAVACSYASGSSHFRFRVASPELPLRLRRTFDAGVGTPGDIAGSAGAEVRVNGVVAGRFAPVIANPARRWQQQEITLDGGAIADVLDIEIIPEFAAYAPWFSESAWELRGGWKDAIFADGFDTVAAN